MLALLRKVYQNQCKVIVILILIVILTFVHSVQAEQSDEALYAHIMKLYVKDTVDIKSAENKLETLQSQYNIANHNNLQYESYEAVKEYALILEQEVEIRINEEVENLQAHQQDTIESIEELLEELSPKELSKLNRDYYNKKDKIDSLLKERTKVSSLFDNPTFDRIDVTELESSIQEQQDIISYNSYNTDTNIGELNKLRLPFKHTKRVTSNAGYRVDPIHGKIRFHNATDYALPVGTELYSVFNGTVVRSDNTGDGYGENIKIDCGNGIILHYAHLDKRYVNVGDRVNQNQLIGLSGNTGRSTGPHLHLGLYYKGQVLDIERLLRNE